MATPNYKSPTGGLVTNRYDFQNHITGTAFRHNSNQIDVSPPVDVNGAFYNTVSDALAAMSALTSATSTLIFKPHGVANSNVYTSWTALMVARSFVQDLATIVIDSLANTIIAPLSNLATLPQATIHVGSTAGFTVSGTIRVVSSSGVQVITYSGITSNSFTGCAGGIGILSTGGFVYQNNGATIDIGVWDLTGNTEIVGNLYGNVSTTYTSELIIPDGARLLNPIAFRNLHIETISTNPSGAIDIAPPFTVYQVEFSNVTIHGSGSGPCMNAKTGSINLNNSTVFFPAGPPIIGGSALATTLNVYINDGSNVADNSFNISAGTINAYINSMAATCGSIQVGAVNVQGLNGDVNGTPGANTITNISGDGINPVNINTRVLQWSSSVGTPVTLTQAQSISGSGATLEIGAQAAASSSNGDGGDIVIAGGAPDGIGAYGSVTLRTSNSQNQVIVNQTGATISGHTDVFISIAGANQITTNSTTITTGIGGANTSTIFQVGGVTNLTLTTSLLQWGATVPGPVTINQAQAASGGGGQLVIAAQAAAAASNANGGLLELTSGAGDGSGSPGSILLLTGDFHNGAAIVPGQIDFIVDSSVMLGLGSAAGGLSLGNSAAIDLTSGGTITLSSDQYKFPYLVFNGILPNNTTIVLPASTGSKWIIDASAVTLSGHTITLKANGNNWGTTIGITNLYEVTYGGTGKLYGVTLAP